MVNSYRCDPVTRSWRNSLKRDGCLWFWLNVLRGYDRAAKPRDLGHAVRVITDRRLLLPKGASLRREPGLVVAATRRA